MSLWGNSPWSRVLAPEEVRGSPSGDLATVCRGAGCGREGRRGDQGGARVARPGQVLTGQRGAVGLLDTLHLKGLLDTQGRCEKRQLALRVPRWALGVLSLLMW